MHLAQDELVVKKKNERIGLEFSTFSNVLFIILEIVIAHFSNSKAVLIDGLFDGCETVLLIFSLWLMKYLYKPVSEKRPIGYSNLEPFYMILKGLLFLVIAILMAESSIHSLLSGGYKVKMTFVSYFELFAGAYGILAFFVLKQVNLKAKSSILLLEIKEWIFNIIASLATGAAFIVASLAQFTPMRFLSNYLDQIITMLMIVYILPTLLKAMKRGFEELFFLSPNREMLKTTKSIAKNVAAQYGFSEEQLDIEIVKTGRRLWVSVYIVPRTDWVDVNLLKKLHAELVMRYSSLADIVDVDVIPDIE